MHRCTYGTRTYMQAVTHTHNININKFVKKIKKKKRFLSAHNLKRAGKAWRWEQEAPGHIAFVVRNQNHGYWRSKGFSLSHMCFSARTAASTFKAGSSLFVRPLGMPSQPCLSVAPVKLTMRVDNDTVFVNYIGGRDPEKQNKIKKKTKKHLKPQGG